MTQERTPAQLYALVFGAVLLVVGIVGFIADSSFGSGGDVDGSDLIIFEINGWHNLVHIASGLVGLALWRSPASARLFALGFGAVYLVVTVWGFVTGDHVLWLLPVDVADNLLHLVIAGAGLAAGLASPAASAAPAAPPSSPAA
jgi:Domain of unknown function (DUF4383)